MEIKNTKQQISAHNGSTDRPDLHKNRGGDKNADKPDNLYNFKNFTQVYGGLTPDETKRAVSELANNATIPAKTLFGSEAGQVAFNAQKNQIDDAKKQVRTEIVRNDERSGAKTLNAGGRETRVEVKVDFEQSVKRAKNQESLKTPPTNSEQRTELNQISRRQIGREIKQMKLKLAENGSETVKNRFTAANGRSYSLRVNAEWNEKALIKTEGAENPKWVEAKFSDRPQTGWRREDSGESLTAPTDEYVESVSRIAHGKYEAQKSLNEQSGIEKFTAESRTEMISEGKTHFQDRQIVGEKAYSLDINVDFAESSKKLNPEKSGYVARQIAANPQLDEAQIAKLRADFSSEKRAELDYAAAQLKQRLAASGDRQAVAKVKISGETYKVTVKADWDVDAEKHRVKTDDVKRYLRDSLAANGGEQIKGVFRFGGSRFKGEADADFGLKLEKLKSSSPSLLEVLQTNRGAVTAKQFQQAKERISLDTQFKLGIAAKDMQRDLARTNGEKMTRVVEVNGERYRITAETDWNLDVDKMKSDTLAQFLKAAAVLVGAATGQIWIPAAASFADAAVRGDELGMITSGLSFASGVSTGSISSLLNSGSRLIGAGSTILNPRAGLSDKVLAGVSLTSNIAKFGGDFQLARTLNDIAKWGDRANSLSRGDAVGLFNNVVGDYIGKAVRRGIGNPAVNQSNKAANPFGRAISVTDLLNDKNITFGTTRLNGLNAYTISSNDLQNFVKDSQPKGKDLTGLFGKNDTVKSGTFMIVPIPLAKKGDSKGLIIPIPSNGNSLKGSAVNAITPRETIELLRTLKNWNDKGVDFALEQLQKVTGRSFTPSETRFFRQNPGQIYNYGRATAEAVLLENTLEFTYGREANINDNDAINAAKHAYWSALMTRYGGNDTQAAALARDYGLAHEAIGENLTASQQRQRGMDLHNNRVGRIIALDHPDASNLELVQLILDAAQKGYLARIQDLGKPTERVIRTGEFDFEFFH